MQKRAIYRSKWLQSSGTRVLIPELQIMEWLFNRSFFKLFVDATLIVVTCGGFVRHALNQIKAATCVFSPPVVLFWHAEELLAPCGIL